jgi:hypothetical protein
MQAKLQKPKLKHNKKRNTAFLFESLIKELTKAVVYSDKQKQKSVSILLKQHFSKNNILEKELSLYKQIYETKKFPKEHAEKLIKEVKSEREKLRESDIFSEQSKLISKINKILGIEVYNNFVPNYKTLASISQLFSTTVQPKTKVLLEQELVEYISSDEESKKINLKTIDNVTYKKFVDKFNDTYGTSLLSEQKQLLSKYINSTTDSIDLKIYLNEEFGRLKNELKILKNSQWIKEEEETKDKVDKLFELLSSLKIEEVTEELIKKTMLIQEFVNEVKK